MKQFRRDKIRLYAFLTVCLVVLILMSTVGVFAEDLGSDILQDYGITSEQIFVEQDSDLDLDCFVESGSSVYNDAVAVINHGMPIYDFIRPYYLNTSDYPKYFMFFYDTGLLSIMQLPEDSFVTVYTDSVKVYSNQADFHVFDGYIKYFSYSAGGIARDESVDATSFLNNTYSHNNTNYGICQALPSRSPSCYIVATNCPIYHSSSSSDSLDFVDFSNDYNYLHSGNSTDDESELNNLYFPTSDFKWRVDSYGISYNWPSSDLSSRDFAQQALSNADRNMLKKSNWGSGAVDFTAVTTDYQKEHPDEFYIKFKFMCWMKYFTPTPLTAIEGSSWKGFYIFATNPYEVDVPLSTFINNGNIKTFNMSDIFSNLSITSTNTEFNTTIQGAYRQLQEQEYLLWDNSTDLGWKLQASAQIYPIDSNLNENSGFNTETYNFITQISKQTEDSLSTNDYPYSPDDETNENTPDIGGDNSQTVTSDNGQITLTNNDNDIININDGNAETVENIYNDLTVSDGEDSLSQRFKDLVNENAWITIMQETFSFIPSSIWVSVEIFVVTCLGILAASFVLRIILDLL